MVEFLVLGLASFRLTRFFVQDFLLNGLRERFWLRFPPESSKLGYFSTCSWCLGFWVSLGVFFCYTIVPLQTLWVAYVFALSALVGLLTAFEDRL